MNAFTRNYGKAEVHRGLARTQFCRGVLNALESIRHFYESILRTTRKRALPLIIRSGGLGFFERKNLVHRSTQDRPADPPTHGVKIARRIAIKDIDKSRG
jgi:hypothetical protein